MKRHRLDPFSLTFGLAFTVLGLVMLDPDVDAVDLVGAGWLPAPLVLAGVILLAVGIDRARSGRVAVSEDHPPAEDGAEPTADA